MAIEATSEEEGILPYGAINGTLDLSRDELLILLSQVVRSQHYKIVKGRIRDIKNEKLRLEGVRVLAYLCSVYGGLLRDKDLKDIERRLEALENANKQH